MFIKYQKYKLEKCICNVCGKEYYVAKSQLKRTKYCSEKCFRKSKNTQIKYSCDYCGKEFLVPKSKVKRHKCGTYCSAECAREAQKPKFEDIKKVFGNMGYILLSKKYESAKVKLEYICAKHADKGSQFVTYNNIKNGFGCKYCGRDKQAAKRRLSFDEVREIFAKNNMDIIEQEYKNTSQKIAYICRRHKERGIQYMCVSDAYVQHCPYCHKSKGEDKIQKFLMQNNVKFEAEKKYDGLVGTGRGSLRYDFFLPQYNTLIEYQGEFHDGTVGGTYQTQEAFEKQKKHDELKRDYANKNGIQLLEIWYYDFHNIEQILKEKLLI